MIEIKTFITDSQPPTEEELIEAVQKCEKDGCAIKLEYVMFGKNYTCFITENVDPVNTAKQLRERVWAS
jgi:hypothetical protein